MGFHGVGPELLLSCLQHNEKEWFVNAALLAQQVMFSQVGPLVSLLDYQA